MRGGKRWDKAKEKISKEAEEDRIARAVTDRQTDGQTDKLNKQCCSVVSLFNLHSIATQKNH